MRSFCVVIIRGTIVRLRIALLVALLLAPSARGATSILAIGDFGVGGKRQREFGAAVRAYEERNPSQLLVTLGDNDYTRGRSFASSWNASFGWLAPAEVGVAGALGNHDVQVRRGRYEFGLLRMPGPYYVRRVGEVELIVLDSTAISTGQTAWLRQTLATRTGFTRVVVLHHPPFTCGGHLGSVAVRRSWMQLFVRGGVHLVLSGHDHNYQRFERDGVTFVVHGGGAAGLYTLRPCPVGYPRRVAARVGHGFVHVTADAGSLLVRIVDLTGKTIDRFEVTG
jgi:Calcineurin-like phosphoesterase